MSAKKNLQGQRFGKLIVIQDSSKRALNKSVIWECLCDCGITTFTTSTSLISGHTKSCGCYNKERISECNGKDLIGRVFDYLTVVEKTGMRHGRAVVWECLCRCGKKVFVNTSSLTSGHTKSCGCFRLEYWACITKADTRIRLARRIYDKSRTRRERLHTPPWSDLTAIKSFYKGCPKGMSVDHIIPLKGRLVSGLHVPDNLRYLDMRENSKKNNTFLPYIEVKNI